MSNKNKTENRTYEAEVLESTVIDEDLLRSLLVRSGRAVTLPALEALELFLDPTTPSQVKASMLAGLTYLIMPLDFIPDFIPVGGFSDDLVALTAVISIWSGYMTPAIKLRALERLDKWFPTLRQ